MFLVECIRKFFNLKNMLALVAFIVSNIANFTEFFDDDFEVIQFY